MLTLGTGSLYRENRENGKIPKVLPEERREEILKNRLEKGEFPYIKAKYIVEDLEEPQEPRESEFIAEPLLEHYNPDIVIVIGTVKSSWANMYSKFGSKDYDTLKKLSDLEWDNGKDTGGTELETIQGEINSIFQDVFGKERQVKIILTRYGLNKEELLENYKILSGMKEIFEDKDEYEVAFDITHSFRSMPIYNLVIFNYLKHIYQYNITIKHVYYGNVETKRENDDKAPIIDLYDLAEVMDLTNGISEFKNTGNAITLCSHLPDDNQLKKELSGFDWATQINSYNHIKQSLIDLIRNIKKQEKSENKFVDINDMIKNVLQNKFFCGKELTAEILESIQVEEMQFMICKWYYQQNRYGQAIATAMEALRSMLVPLYLEIKQKDISSATCGNETYRREAVQRLSLLLTLDEESYNEYDKFLRELEKCRRCACEVRNNFAHNLNNKVTCACEKCQVKENERCEIAIINQFMNKIEQLHFYIYK